MGGRAWIRITAIALAFLMCMTATVSAQTNDVELTLRARGTTGAEILQVRNANAILAEFTLETDWNEFDVSVSASTSFETLSVGFINNQHEPVDRNVLVDWVELGGERRQAESADVWATGRWSPETGCTSGPSSSETLNCSGFFHFGGQPTGSTIVAHAVGATGTENLELLIDEIAVATQRVTAVGNVWSSRTATEPFVFTLPVGVSHDRLRVAFVNDGDFEGADRNVRIDRIEVDGANYETEDPRIESTGTWGAGRGCSRGFFESQTLACDGWFQLPGGQGVDEDPSDVPPATEETPSAPVAPAAPLPLSVEVVADDLTNPWGMAFLPSGELLFAERLGRLNLLTDSGVTRISADFSNLGAGTSGLLGLAIDADFASNRRFYTCQGQQSPGRQQIVAWELSEDFATATRQETLVDIGRTGAHSGCRLGVDGDGYLIATFGDDFVATTPQDTTSLHGKILRIDPLTGAGHPDNGSAGPDRDARIFTLGHRNPQGLSFHPETGQAWIVEHGPDRDDEINALQNGGNYGWNPIGPGGPAIYDELGRTMTDPNIAGAIEAVWSSGSSTIAPGDIEFLVGEHWNDFDGAIAMTTLKDERLHLVRIDDGGDLVDLTTPPELDESEYGRLRSATLGPDGALYVSTSNSGFGNEDFRRDSILRVAPSGFASPSEPEPVDPGPVEPQPGARTIAIVSRGSTGTERLHLDIDGIEVHAWTPGTDFAAVTYTHDLAVTGSQVRVRFSNDGLDGGRDRNVWVDSVQIGSELFESEHPTVLSRGAWANGARCRQGTFNTEFLACNGWFQYADDGGTATAPVDPVPEPDPAPVDPVPEPDPAASDVRIEVRARGTTGEEILELQIAGETVQAIELTTGMASYAYDFSGAIGQNDVRLVFTNDGRSASGADRNVRVDYLQLGSDRYQTESPDVLSTGTYTSATRCAPGNKQSEWIHCSGYVQYSVAPVVGSST